MIVDTIRIGRVREIKFATEELEKRNLNSQLKYRQLQTVAKGLGKLKDKVAFVGGAVAELYASDPATSEIRPTQDVDCVIELKRECQNLLKNENLIEGIESALSYGSDSDSTEKVRRSLKVLQ